MKRKTTKPTAKIITVQPIVERSDAELLTALEAFLTASVETVGVNNTYDTVSFLTGVIRDSPATYKKIFKPETLARITEIYQKAGRGDFGYMDMLGLFSEVQEMFG